MTVKLRFQRQSRWDRRNRLNLIESATPCHDAQVVGSYRVSNPLRLIVLAAMSDIKADFQSVEFSERGVNSFVCERKCRSEIE